MLADTTRGFAAKVVVEQRNGRIGFRADLGRSRCVKHSQSCTAIAWTWPTSDMDRVGRDGGAARALLLADTTRGFATKVVLEQRNGRIGFRAALGRSRCVKHSQSCTTVAWTCPTSDMDRMGRDGGAARGFAPADTTRGVARQAVVDRPNEHGDLGACCGLPRCMKQSRPCPAVARTFPTSHIDHLKAHHAASCLPHLRPSSETSARSGKGTSVAMLLGSSRLPRDKSTSPTAPL